MSEIDLGALSQPFPASEVEWRVGSTNQEKTKGLALAYLTARHIMDRLDAVCGPANWQDSYVETGRGRVIATLSLRINGEWVAKSDGAGDSDVEAEKGAISDALKRAAVHWGIGRYLYLLGNTWVGLEKAGNSYKIAAHEYGRLEKLLVERFGTTDFVQPDSKNPKSREDFNVVMELLRQAGQKGRTSLREFWESPNFKNAIQIMPADWRQELVAEKDAFIASYPAPRLKADPNDSLDKIYRETVG